MDKVQADAIVNAILEPDFKVQDEIRRKRADEALKLVSQQRLARFVFVGFAMGAAVGHFAFDRLSFGGLIGAFMAVLVARFSERRIG